MTLNELLTELRTNILYDRSDRVAGTPDYLWSDATLIRYINEAQNRFARLGLVIRDGTTPDATEVMVQAGVTEYPLHPSVLAVISAKMPGDIADLARAGHQAFQTYRQPDPYFFNPADLSTMPPGKPLAYGTDEYLSGDDYGATSVATLRLYPEPTADYEGQILKLRVVRLPLTQLSTTCGLDQPEIPAEHHLEMLDWAAYLALRIVDVDAGFQNRANEFRASFEDHVKRARNMAMRKMFTPAQWGFGRNGFSWEH